MAGSQEKTEKPTSKRLGEARRKGNVARSRDLNSLVSLYGGIAALVLSAPTIMEEFRLMLEYLWSHGFYGVKTSHWDHNLFVLLVTTLFKMISPALFTAMILAMVINFFQLKGVLLSMETIKPDLAKLNPFSGFKQFVSLRSMTELIKSIIKITVVSYAIYTVFQDQREEFVRLAYTEPGPMMALLWSLTFKILWRVGVILLVMTILDLYYQRWQHTKDLMMTKEEIKEEMKQAEGNPQVKSKIRSIQRSIARQRMMSKVPEATVVITNPTHYAVALKYDEGMDAPTVIAKGMNIIAQQIITIARKHGVPIVQNPPLARALYREVDLDQAIPETLYRAVAKILAYVYHRQNRVS